MSSKSESVDQLELELDQVVHLVELSLAECDSADFARREAWKSGARSASEGVVRGLCPLAPAECLGRAGARALQLPRSCEGRPPIGSPYLPQGGAPGAARSAFLERLVCVLFIAAGLVMLLAGCQTADAVPEPRLLTGSPMNPVCLVFCQVSQSIVSHEPITGDGIQATTTGGSVSGSQSRGQ